MFDSDTVYTTNNEIIINSVHDLPTIVCTSGSSDKKSNISERLLIDSNKNGFGNAVGYITNIATGMYEKMSLFDKDSDEYKELDYRLKTMQKYQQDEIDKIKGIVAKPVKKEWYVLKENKYLLDKDTGEVLDDHDTIIEKDFNFKICSNKKPYFFIYIYDSSMKKYKNFIKQANTNCKYRFRCDVKELITKEYNTDDERVFLEQYNNTNPFGMGSCIVNKIAWKIEDEFSTIGRVTDKCYENYQMYMNDKFNTIKDNSYTSKIKKIYEEYKKSKRKSKTTESKEEGIEIRMSANDSYKSKISEIISNENELTNTLIYLSYVKNSISKPFVWNMCGDTIIENMLNNNSNTIKYPVKSTDGDIRYGNERYKMVEKVIEIQK